MPYSLENCYITSESSSQFADMGDALAAAAVEAQRDIDAILAEPKLAAMLSTLQAGVSAHSATLTSPDVTTVDAMLKDMGILGFNATPRDYQKVTEDKGFMFVDGNLFLVNQYDANAVTQKAPPSVYSITGLGKGVTDVDLDYMDVLGGSTYSASLVQNSGSYSQSAYKANSKAVNSTTGTEYQVDGNVSVLREMLRAAGGDLDVAAKIAKIGQTVGYAVVWSRVDIKEHPVGQDAMGDITKVRESYSYPVYDDQVTFHAESNLALVSVEKFVGLNMSRAAAELAVSNEWLATYGVAMTHKPLLTCRVFRFCLNNVLNTAPVFITHGMDASKLGADAYSLGISIGGYAIVVDVTGDRGTGTIGTYTPQSVAACITAQLGDLISVRVFGGELVITSKVRGTQAYIQLFDTVSSASVALGVDGAIYQLNGLLGTTSAEASRLARVKTVTVSGGSSGLADTDLSGLLFSNAQRYGLTDEQLSAVVSGDYYWDALKAVSSRSKSVFEAITSDLSSTTGSPDRAVYMARTLGAAALLVQDTIFMDIPAIDCRMFSLFRAEFGDEGLIDILAQRPGVYDLSFNIPVSVGYSYLGQLLDKQVQAGGVETKQSSVDYISAFHTNASLVWKLLDRIEYLDIRANELDDTLFVAELLEILGLGAGIAYSLVPTTAKGDSTVSTTTSGDTDLALRMQNPNWGQDILDAIAAASVLTIPQDWLNRQEKTATRMLTNVENDITDWMDDKLSSLVDTLSLDDEIAVARRNYRRLLNALKDFRRYVKIATDFVQRQQLVYANLLKIVNAGLNFNTNMYANFEVNTKFVSCYASGTSSAALSQAFKLLVTALNTVISFINKALSALAKIVDKFFTVLSCTLQALFSFFSASLTYETSAMGAYTALGVPMAVSFKLKCSVNLGYEPDTTILALLGQIQSQLNALFSSLKLSTVTWSAQESTTDSLKTTLSGTGISALVKQFEDKLAGLTGCFA